MNPIGSNHPSRLVLEKLCSGLLGVLIIITLATGCKPQASTGATTSSGYFHTPFQSESQFIVEAIVSDLAEQMYYAANHRLPETNFFSVAATEKPGSPTDAPVYELQINLNQKPSGLKLDLNVNGPIWSPEMYRDVATALAQAVGLGAGITNEVGDPALLSKLLDGTPETIEQENQTLSAALEKEFTNPELHEQAALLLGAFLLRDHSGHFFEIRSPLCRLTAHLALARFLRGADSFGVNGRLAKAMLLTLEGDEAPALEQLKTLDMNSTVVAGMVRALQARNTGDFRPLTDTAGRTRVESVAWFAAMADYVSTPIAWVKLDDEQKRTIDFVRVANEEGYSVEIGHELLQASIPLELQEIRSVYKLSHDRELSRGELISSLNALPERCFATGSDGAVHVRVIGWGQWAAFLQRHLCHAVQQNFYFMNSMWGVPDDAKEFAAKCEPEFGGLRLYPFVRRFNCTDVNAYHQSVDDGFKVTVATPQLVSAECWNYLCYRVSFAPWYKPNPNPHVNEWHNHNPPPGTVYNLHPRLNHPSLIDRSDAIAKFEQLHQLAPYDCRIGNFIIKKKYGGRPTRDQAMALYGAMLPYSVTALRTVAGTVYDQPDQYEKLMLQAAELNPACYYDIGDYALNHTNDDQAALYIDKACDTDPDSVRVASHAIWRVRHYLKEGQTDKAREIADFAGEVYSHRGLEAKAIFFETTTNYDGAFEWYAKIDERYEDPGPLLHFCARYQSLTGDQRFEPEVQKRIRKLFPKGIEKVALSDFHGPPADGVLIKEENDLLKSAGLNKGDVIVAVYGVRVHNFQQYTYSRELKNIPELDLIAWHGGAYHEFKPSPPNHLFGLDFGDYNPD
jgi:tetratricopeptide (TPR) repeat protein